MDTTMDTRSSPITRTSDQHPSTSNHLHHNTSTLSTSTHSSNVSSKDRPVPLRIIHSSASIVSIPSPRPTFPRGMSFDDGLSQWEVYADRMSMEGSRVEYELKRMRGERPKGTSTASSSVRSKASSRTPGRYRRKENNNGGGSLRSEGGHGSANGVGNEEDKGQGQLRRQATVSSSSTEKMESSFRDFDGVHAEIGSIAEEQDGHDEEGLQVGKEEEEELIELQDVELEQDATKDIDDAARTTPTLQDRPRPRSQSPFPKMGQPVPGMIYYPAPVPRLLNLPKPLSQQPHPDETTTTSTQKNSNEFMIPQDLDLVNGSATLTLDCILDAAAFTPSDGISQNPMDNSRGKEAFRRSALQKAERGRRRQTKTPDSFIDVDLDGKDNAHPRSSSESWTSGESRTSSVDSISRILHPSQPLNHESFLADLSAQGPTTLLAELQLRKTQQKNRMKTAQTAFPNGAHTTLLQLDAVAEYQMDIRKGKVAPAFEEYDVESGEDDVPLGVLFPGVDSKSILNAEDDDEPLSRRKKRLQRENERPALIDLDLGVQNDDATGNVDEDEDQPLSRRKKDLQSKTQPDDFTSTVFSSLAQVNGPQNQQAKAGKDDAASISVSMKSATDSGQSESIAQRKRRLQAERLARASKVTTEIPTSSGMLPQQQYGFQPQLPAQNSFNGMNYASSVQNGHLMSMSGASNPYLYPMQAPMNGSMYGGAGTYPNAFMPQAYGGAMPVNMFPPFHAPFNQSYPMAPAMSQQFAPGLQRPYVGEQSGASRQTWSSRR